MWRRGILLLCCFLVFRAGAHISVTTVHEWAQQLGEKLWQVGDAITGWRELKQKFNKQVQYKFVSKDDRILVQEIADSIYNMTRLKVSAVKRIVKNAETMALQLYNKTKKLDINHTYFGTKADDPEGDPLHHVIGLDVTENSHFRGEPVNLTYSSVHIPTNVYNRAPHIVKVIEWTEELEETFRSNYEQDPSLSWQYFGSYTGVMRQYPGVIWEHSTDNVDMFDCRMRLWYIEASTSPKDVIILVDNSGSMAGKRHEIARHLVNNILETLGSNDFVTVLKFNNRIKSVVECFNDTLVQANLGNVRDLKLAIKSLKAEEMANFELALTTAFDLLQRAENESEGASCNRAIMLITDGLPDYYKEIFDKYNGYFAMGVRMFMYLIGEEDPVAREMQWIACKNNGYYVPLKTSAEVREKVLRYMPVMSRPLVLAKERPINWSPVYADVADPRLTDWLWIQRENEEQHEVSNYCYFPKKWRTLSYNVTGKVFKNCTEEPEIKRTKTPQILGVAGTDVPIEDVKRLLLPYRVGVNGYAFIITNNGHMIVHPDLRAEFLGILKPHYNSVDLIEVELVDDDSLVSRTINEELLEMRASMIEQEYGVKTLNMKYHSDNMRRVSTVVRNFHYIGIKDTPFSLGVAVPNSYGLSSIHVPADKVRMYTAKIPPRQKEFKEFLQQIQDFIKDDTWTIHPEWMYCKYHYDTAHDFPSPEDELRHFLQTRGVQCTSPRHLMPPELLQPSYERLSKDACYCDQDILTSLISDVIETRMWPMKNMTWLKTYGITQVFLSLHSGLTRWVTILDDGDATYFKNNHKKAIDELWYQRAVELQTKDGTYVYSVPFSDERGDNVTATAAIFIDSKKVPVAVVGYRIQYPNLHSLFTRYTSKECTGTGCTTCLSDEFDCYILDNNAYIVVSEIPAEKGMFFGEVHGQIFNMMVEEQVFRKVRIFDYQAICLREDEEKSLAPFLKTPFQHALHLVEWIIGTTIWLFTQTNLWLESSTFAAKVKPTQLPRDDVKINRTHLEPCVKQVDLYHLQNHTYPDPKVFTETSCKNPNVKPFVVQKVAHSNLILVVVDTLCGDDPDMEVQIVRREVDDTEMVGCLNALNANLTRKRPKVCVGKADKGKKLLEPPSSECGCDSQFRINLILIVFCWSIRFLLSMQH